jgi:hypothetical protein
MIARVGLRMAVAGVWLYQGTWKKVLRPDATHLQIVAAVPGLDPEAARLATAGLGLFESGLALWAVSGRRSRAAAATQTVALVAMNAGGLAFAPSSIRRPGRMLARNAVFLACVWAGA